MQWPDFGTPQTRPAAPMSGATGDLLFWIVLFVVLGVVIRYLQRKKQDKD